MDHKSISSCNSSNEDNYKIGNKSSNSNKSDGFVTCSDSSNKIAGPVSSSNGNSNKSGGSTGSGSGNHGKKNLKPAKLFKSNAILVTNGSIRDYGSLRRTLIKNFLSLSDAFIIAADGGALHCSNLRITPNVIIGDMDSITKGMIAKLVGTAGSVDSDTTTGSDIQFISFNQDKDESDTQLALDYLVEKGYERIIVIGAFGSRADHSYANLSLLSSPAYDNVKVSIITENSEIFVVKDSCTIKGEAGKKISIFSLTPFTFFEKTIGLKYKLKNEKLLFSPARGLSNEFTKDTAKLNISEGWLLIVREL
jgi:thiamine pyrophosphokinase